jgi:hypothetical protein
MELRGSRVRVRRRIGESSGLSERETWREKEVVTTLAVIH